jgi:metallophosphoesterase (TIGR00282 family)
MGRKNPMKTSSNTIDHLLGDIPIPRVVKVQQKFERPLLKDVEAVVLDRLRSAYNVGNIFRLAEVTRLRTQTDIIVVDFHAEATSEKIALGRYLDGKVTAVFGTHTHVQTADERILPKGTAYITDAGMVGGRNAVIGIARDQALQRFLTSRPQRFEPSRDGLFLSCVFIEVDVKTGKALSIKREVLAEDGHEE